MLEQLLFKKSKPPYLMDINFANAVVGSQSIVDQGTQALPFTRNTSGTGSGKPDGVVNHPTYGMTYYFNGATAFIRSQAFSLNAIFYRLDFEMVTETTTSMILFETGDFPSFAGFGVGSALSLNQFPSTYVQWFQAPNTSNWRRVLLDGANNQVMESYSIIRLPSGTTIRNNTRGIQNSVAELSTNGDSWTWLGAGNNSGALNVPFQGWLRSLRISKAA